MGAGIPAFGREQLPAHMLLLLVGLLHKFLHQVVLLHTAFLGQAHYLGAVVILGAVVHLVVHPAFLALEHALGEADGIQQFGHRQLGHLLQRVEEVHDHQVLPRRLVQVVHAGVALVGQHVVIGLCLFHLAAEARQFLDEHVLHQRQQGAHLGVCQIVFLFHLHLTQVAEQETLVNLVVALLQEAQQQLFQRRDALHADAAEFAALQVHLHHLLLLADHVIIVEHPFVGASHEPLALGLFDQKHIIPRYLSNTLFESSVSTLHTRLLLRYQGYKDTLFF